jgi:hypothetical protein
LLHFKLTIYSISHSEYVGYHRNIKKVYFSVEKHIMEMDNKYILRNTYLKLKSLLSSYPFVRTGVDLELREDVVHQFQRRHQPCLLVNRSTQTVTVAMNNSNSNASCPSNQQQQQQLPIAKLTTTCHIINSSSNGPISLSTSQQKQQIKDVQL